jgi:hypothetical protein
MIQIHFYSKFSGTLCKKNVHLPHNIHVVATELDGEESDHVEVDYINDCSQSNDSNLQSNDSNLQSKVSIANETKI